MIVKCIYVPHLQRKITTLCHQAGTGRVEALGRGLRTAFYSLNGSQESGVPDCTCKPGAEKRSSVHCLLYSVNMELSADAGQAHPKFYGPISLWASLSYQPTLFPEGEGEQTVPSIQHYFRQSHHVRRATCSNLLRTKEHKKRLSDRHQTPNVCLGLPFSTRLLCCKHPDYIARRFLLEKGYCFGPSVNAVWPTILALLCLCLQSPISS